MKTKSFWIPKLKKGAGPAYQLIANAIAEDIATGQLSPGQRLPPQRKLADALELDFTTVARAYNEAQKRGLVEATVGRGTFIAGQRRPRIPRVVDGRPNVDMSMNMPPEPDSAELKELMQAGFVSISEKLPDLLRYQNFGGSAEDKEAGTLWLRRRGLQVSTDRLLVVPGAQVALLTLLSVLAPSGSVICCEDVTYPGLRALAGQLGVRLVGLPMDAEGIDAVAFAGACAQYAPKALYCNPTFLNPTTTIISEQRRRALVEVARNYNVPIIEDDAYGFLPKSSPSPLASIGPDIVFYVAGLAKCVGAGLRVAYMAAPDTYTASRLAAALRATAVMASPMMSALATRWIRDGTADVALNAIRKEAAFRQKLAARFLPPGSYVSKPEAFHIWIQLPPVWEQNDFAKHLETSGIGVVASDAFCVGGQAPAAVRVCIGGIASRHEIEHALRLIGNALRNGPMSQPAVV